MYYRMCAAQKKNVAAWTSRTACVVKIPKHALVMSVALKKEFAKPPSTEQCVAPREKSVLVVAAVRKAKRFAETHAMIHAPMEK
jgi:hypothetical protein